MYFTFLSITYNHEKFIYQHLESIRFQIINYGIENDFQLIISDDFSTDETINHINKWLEVNGYLFKSIKILKGEANVGLCKNYVKGIGSIDGEYFKALAGDDLYARECIFDAIDLLEKYDMVTTPVAEFIDNRLFSDNKIYSRIFSMYKFAYTPYKRIRKYNIQAPMTPGVFIKKDLLTPEVLDFIVNYKFIEDRSQSVKIYEMNNELKIGNCDKIFILYRHHPEAITKTVNQNISREFREDDRRINEYINSNTKSIIVKVKNSYDSFVLNLNSRLIRRILNINIWSYRMSFLLNYKKYKKKIDCVIKRSYLQNEKFIYDIWEEVKQYEQ